MKKLDISLKFIDPFFKKIGKLSKSKRILIGIASFIILIGLFIYFLYLPKFESLNQLELEYNNYEKRLNLAKNRGAQLNKHIKEIKIVEKNYRVAMKALPDKKEIPSLLTSITESGKDAGLEFILFQPEEEISKDFYIEMPVSIKVVGNYHNIAIFFDKISRLSRIVNIKNILITSTADGNILNSSCTAITYRFMEPDEKIPNSDKEKKGKK